MKKLEVKTLMFLEEYLDFILGSITIIEGNEEEKKEKEDEYKDSWEEFDTFEG